MNDDSQNPSVNPIAAPPAPAQLVPEQMAPAPLPSPGDWQARFVRWSFCLVLLHCVWWVLPEGVNFLWWVISAGLLALVIPVLLVAPIVAAVQRRQVEPWPPLLGLGTIVLFIAEIWFGLSTIKFGGISPWGRPLRIRGKEVYPELSPSTAWANGPKPEIQQLDPATRLALATLWHHDAQKEHASVPAFSRIAWVLVGLGAGPDLVRWCHTAAQQEIDHAERCFAVAGSYAGCSQGPDPMPQLLRENLSYRGSTLRELLVETLRDGCLIEDFNADVAEVAARHATDPAIKILTERIANDERDHAALAWEILAWGLQLTDAPLRRELLRAVEDLNPHGPIPYGPADAAVIDAASPERLVEHGRVPPAEWPKLFAVRLEKTRKRAKQMIEQTDSCCVAA